MDLPFSPICLSKLKSGVLKQLSYKLHKMDSISTSGLALKRFVSLLCGTTSFPVLLPIVEEKLLSLSNLSISEKEDPQLAVVAMRNRR